MPIKRNKKNKKNYPFVFIPLLIVLLLITKYKNKFEMKARNLCSLIRNLKNSVLGCLK